MFVDEKKDVKGKLKAALKRGVLGGVFIFLSYWGASLFDSALFAASIGASTFIVCVFPKANSARIKYMLGGYLTASVVGCVLSFIRVRAGAEGGAAVAGLVAVSIFLAILLMDFFDLEHPPAAALCISITLSGRPVIMSVCAVVSVLALFMVKVFYLKTLNDDEGMG